MFFFSHGWHVRFPKWLIHLICTIYEDMTFIWVKNEYINCDFFKSEINLLHILLGDTFLCVAIFKIPQ